MLKNLILGVIMLVVAVVYVAGAMALPRSALSDAVGASGFPLLIGWTMIGLSALLIAQSLVFILRDRQRPSRPEPADAPAAEEPDEIWADPRRAFLSAAGLAAIAAAFLFLLPTLGYPLSIALLIVATASFVSRSFNRQQIFVALGGAAGLTILFVLVLGIPMPQGFLESLM